MERQSFVYCDLLAPREGNGLDCARRLVVADAYARFRRGQGDDVLFAPAVGGLGAEVEAESARLGISADDLADKEVDRLQQASEFLGVSCDWARGVVTANSDARHRAQLIFRGLFGKDLVYRADRSKEDGGEPPWLFRRSKFAQLCASSLEELPGWTPEAVDAQYAAMGRVEGVEIDAVIAGAGKITVFTPHQNAIERTAFVGVSPNHPEAQAIAAPADFEALQKQTGPIAMVQTAMQAAVPGVEGLVPIVMTPSVDDRFGPTLYLGIPDENETDREIADRLVKGPSLSFRTATVSSKPRAALRISLEDKPISRRGSWGTQVPISHCESCGPVLAEADDHKCPKCGGAATPDSQVIDCEFDDMWAWLTILVPPPDRGQPSLSHPEIDRWLPARQAVCTKSSEARLLDERIAAHVAADLGVFSGSGSPEPFSAVSRCGPVAGEGDGSVEALEDITALDSDAVRLTILHTAATDKGTTWSSSVYRHSQRFLQELRDCAGEWLAGPGSSAPAEIERSTRPRRRLAAWCEIGERKVSTSLDNLEMHKATYGLMLFLKRLKDFEEQGGEGEQADALDRDALSVALLRLVRLSKPIVPNTATELEALALRTPSQ
jgi:leucyl-tRNA synthetase